MACPPLVPVQKGATNNDNNNNNNTTPTTPTLKPVTRFCRQVLQLEPEAELAYPDGTLLREDAAQAELYVQLFAPDALPHPPPPRYQLRVLKTLLARIEAAIEDWEVHGVCEPLMARLASLLASPLPSERAAAQQKSYVTYMLSLLPASSSSASASPPTITLLESRSLISAGGTTGLRTWEAALHLGQYLCTLPASFLAGRTVLELGAGTGYLSVLAACHLGAASVLASDGAEEVVANLPESFFLNGLQRDDGTDPIVRATELRWGHALVGAEEAAWNGGRQVDVVLGADVTYDESVLPALVATLGELLAMFPRATVLIAATERNRQTLDAFRRVCLQNRFRLDEVLFELPGRDRQTGPFYSDKVPIRIFKITV